MEGLFVRRLRGCAVYREVHRGISQALTVNRAMSSQSSPRLHSAIASRS